MSERAHKFIQPDQENILGAAYDRNTAQAEDAAVLSFLQATIANRCVRQNLEIETLSTSEKPDLSIIVGEVLAEHTRLMLANQQDTHPELPARNWKIPGSVAPAVTKVYRETGADQETTDKVKLKKMTDYMQPRLDLAHAKAHIFPEIFLADQIESRWRGEGLTHAPDSVTALKVAYGSTLYGIQRAGIVRDIVEMQGSRKEQWAARFHHGMRSVNEDL